MGKCCICYESMRNLMNIKNEKQLLLVIRYALPVFILFISIIITAFLYFENKSSFEKIKKITEERFISDKKQLIKEQVDNVYDYIVSEQKDTENALKASLISRVHEAHKIIQNIHEKYGKTHTKEQITQIIKAAIKDIRFNNNRGYFFVYDKNAINVIHPLLPHIEGKDLSNYQDTKGTYVIRESLELLKSNHESYQEWYWRKSKADLTEYKKIGFVKNIYELDWFIGTGEYVEDFSLDIQQKVISQIQKFKFGKHGYIFILDKEDRYISHVNSQIISKNIYDIKTIENTKEVYDQVKQKAKSGGGYISYVQKFSPFSKKSAKKIAYVRQIPNWDWVIGTGFYLDDVKTLIEKQKSALEKRHKQNVQSVFIISLTITFLLLLISFYITSIIEKKFKKYKQSIQHHIDENQKQYGLLAQKSKLAAMGEMMENIAHQWRQPLSLITTASTGVKLQKEMDLLTDEFLIESVDSIGNSANHLSETIEDFRDFFKPDKEKTEFTLDGCINKTFKLLASQIKNREIDIIDNIEDIRLRGFERELLQVLLNILNNAKDALSDIDDEKYIFIDIYRTTDGNAVIKIKDNAGGIDESIIERIFEPYFTTKHKSQGTGLGLYMSQEIIARHMNGSLEVSNETYIYKDKQYKGALFTLVLPIEV